MSSYKKIGEKVKLLRKQKGLTQEKLAELAKVDPKSIIDIEKGKRNPTMKTLGKLSVALKVPISNLLN
jgi:transcriptional regulator with XRE-family HTH domain